MIYQLNTGNILPFFASKENQIGRRDDLSCPWGLQVPRIAFLPFQIMSEVVISTFSWHYVNLCDESTEVEMPSSYLKKYCSSETGPQFLVYDGSPITEVDLDCGLYYLVLRINGVAFYSEVMNLQVLCDMEDVGVEITDCALEPVIGGDGVRFTFAASSTTSTLSSTVTSEYNTGSGWVEGTSFALLKSLENAEIRVTMINKCGNTQRIWQIQWDDLDPCGTYFLTDITTD